MAKYRAIVEYEYPEKTIRVSDTVTAFGHHKPDDFVVRVNGDYVKGTLVDTIAVMQEEDEEDVER